MSWPFLSYNMWKNSFWIFLFMGGAFFRACSPTPNASSTLEATELEEDEVVVDDDVLDEDENEAEDCCPIRRNRFNKRHVPRDAK